MKHNPSAYQLLTNVQAVPSQTSPPGFILSIMFSGMEYPFGLFGLLFLAVSPLGFSHTFSLVRAWKAEKVPDFEEAILNNN